MNTHAKILGVSPLGVSCSLHYHTPDTGISLDEVMFFSKYPHTCELNVEVGSCAIGGWELF